MFLSRPHRVLRSSVSIGLAGVLFLLLAFLSASAIASPLASKIVQKLNLNDRLTVKGQGCQPQIQTQTDVKFVILCVANAAQSSEPAAPDTKLTIILKAKDKLTIKRNKCRLQVTALSDKRVVIVCDGGPLPPIILDTTNVLTNESTQYLESVSQDGATFTFSQTTDQLNALAVGEMIVGDVSANAPDGFLRKVVSVTNNGGELVVETEPAAIEDAAEQLEISITQKLEAPTSIDSRELPKGVTYERAPNGEFFFQLQDVVLYDEDGNENTTNDQIVGTAALQ